MLHSREPFHVSRLTFHDYGRIYERLSATIAEGGAIVEFEEAEAFRVAPGADPATERDGVAGFRGSEGVLDQCAHGKLRKVAPTPSAQQALVGCLRLRQATR